MQYPRAPPGRRHHPRPTHSRFPGREQPWRTPTVASSTPVPATSRCKTWTTPSSSYPSRIAVGTALAGGPPRRSQRALLTHWAPDLGSGVKALIGPGMGIAGGREPPIRVAAHLLPVHAVSLAAAPQRPVPVPYGLVADGRHLVDVARDRVVGEVASHHRPEPASLCLDGPVAALHQQDLGLA